MGVEKVEEAVAPKTTMLPEPMMLPWTAKVSLGVLEAMPVLPVGSMTKYGVLVPTVRSPAKVVVPMPTCPPLPELINKIGVFVSVLVPKLMSPQTSSKYLGVVVPMPTLPVV